MLSIGEQDIDQVNNHNQNIPQEYLMVCRYCCFIYNGPVCFPFGKTGPTFHSRFDVV